jgi:large subunit ribosomal protein L32
MVNRKWKFTIHDSRFTIHEEIMPNPKRRHSKTRTRTRRAHDALTVPQYFIDKNSGEAQVPHRISDDGMFQTHKARKKEIEARQIIESKAKE